MKPSPEKHPNLWGMHYRRKSKKLDAICETEYNKNHVESNKVDDLTGENSELRRGSRVRRAPVVLDASPPPPKKRPRVVKDVSSSGRRTAKENLVSMEKVEHSDTPGGWKSRLRSRPKNASLQGGVRVSRSRRRNLFRKANACDLGEEAVGSPNVRNSGESQDEKLMKSESSTRVTVSSSSEENDLEMSNTEEGSMKYIEEVVECEDVAGVEDMVNRIEPGRHISENENEAGVEDMVNKIEPGLDVSENENETGVEDMVNKIEPGLHVSENEDEAGGHATENEAGGHATDNEAGGHATKNHADGHGMVNEGKVRMEEVENGTKLDAEETTNMKEVGPEGMENVAEVKAVGMENVAEVKAVGMDNETEVNRQRTENEFHLRMEEMGSDARLENEVHLRMEGMESDARLEETENDIDGPVIVSESGNDVRNDMPPMNNSFVDKVTEAIRDVSENGKLLQGGINVDHMKTLEDSDEGLELSVQEKEHENQQGVVPDKRYADNNVGEDGEAHVMREQSKKVPFESGSHAKEDKTTHPLTERLSNPCLKQGRRCGLCGGGTNGKPPKKLIEDCSESDKETHCGSSASEDPNYDAWDGFGDDPGWLGRLLGPINDRYGIAGTWVHQHCAVWSPEVYFAGLGRLKNVRAALCRGRTLKCTRCGRPGATIGCRVDRCPKTYHLPCARANSCIFDHRKFLIACTDHRHLFQPYRQSHIRLKKLKTKRMKLEMRKHSTDAWRKDVEAEEKWLERCGEDEEFLKRESKRLQRDLLRVAPVYIGGSDCESGNLYGGWESVAGLQNVIQCMKEVVILPLLYPEFFGNLGLTPPRGVLLHGYPGTGKTLVVRALIGSLARSEKRIAYFARKGADCLGKYVGDAERQLRLLFQVAEKCQPSIIFFDEIDGLAPQRTRQQDQTHSSVVSTLLALLDGLKSRGSVVVIGATNRPDSIDPALRRPGRFDREIYFPLPSLEDRASIISLHTKKWPKPVSGSLLKRVARNTVGFAGADLQALCTQAVIIALKRNFPLHEAMDSAELKTSGSSRVTLPAFLVEERDWLEALSCSPPPCSRREAGIAASDIVSSPLPLHLVPCLLRPLCSLFVSLNLEERIWLPPLLAEAANVVENLIVRALSNKRMPDDCWWSHVDAILEETSVAKDVVRKLLKTGILKRENYMIGPDTNADDAGNDNSDCEPSMAHKVVAHSSLLGKLSLAPTGNHGFRVLVSGSPRSGQRHLAACILHCLVGNIEVHKIDLATICQEGGGNLVDGVTYLLLKCATKRSCAVFMPRIDLWALETPIPLFEDFEEGSDEGSEEGSGEDSGKLGHDGKEHHMPSGSLCGREETKQSGNTIQVSRVWSTFVEQMESMSLSVSLTVLATSSVPYKELPEKIRQYFKTDLSNGYKPMSSQTVPQFAVQVGGSFDRDMAINLSVSELSNHTIQSFISLVHQRNHPHKKILKKYKRLSSGRHSQDNEAEDKSKQPGDCSIQVGPLPISRKLKEKSNSQVAVSTIGIQILQYPHFAELCWVTSKLKEGPSADVTGPWRGWPFNSCVVRPSNSVEQAVLTPRAGNVKGKESSGIVRGLVAIGLSAYRGIYTSSQEVSFEVRKVLELLVGQINTKIQDGKDSYQYVRLLSQVAYLEDMVNSWAYATRSLELDSQTDWTGLKLSGIDDVPMQNEEPESTISVKTVPDTKWFDTKQGTRSVDHAHLNNTEGDFISNSENGLPCLNGGGPVQGIPLYGNPADSRLTVDITEVQKKMNLDPRDSENTGTLPAMQNSDYLLFKKEDGDLVSNSKEKVDDQGEGSLGQILVDLNSSSPADEVDGLDLASCELETTDILHNCDVFEKSVSLDNKVRGLKELAGLKRADSDEACNLTEVPPSVNKSDEPFKQVEDMSPSSTTDAYHAYDSSAICLYHCCPRCVSDLQGLMFKLIVREWDSKGSDIIVEDVHDAVASLSMDLLSVVRKVGVARNNSNTQGANLHLGTLSKCPCKNQVDNLMTPVECSCHSQEINVKETSESTNSWLLCNLDFTFRDGLLVPLDSIKDQSFHCKFDAFCLCSLVESIETGMWPID